MIRYEDHNKKCEPTCDLYLGRGDLTADDGGGQTSESEIRTMSPLTAFQIIFADKIIIST